MHIIVLTQYPCAKFIHNHEESGTILFFDERFNLVDAQDGGVYQQQVAASITSNGASLQLLGVKAPKNGYVFAYVSNAANMPVYSDNFAVSIAEGIIVE